MRLESGRDVERFIDDMKRGRLTRRNFEAGLVAAGLGLAALPLARAGAAGGDHPTCFTWEWFKAPESHRSYIESYGGSPNFALWGDEEEAEARMLAGFRPDIAMPGSYKVRKWDADGFLQEIDTSRLSNWPDVLPVLKGVPDMIVGGRRLMVPGWWGLTSVTFRTDLAPEYADPANHSWGILWDPKYAGRLSMIDSLIDGVMVAAIYSGAADPFDMTAAEVEATRRSMQEQRPLLRSYTNDESSWERGLASGELVAAVSWNGTPRRLLDQGVPVAFMTPKEGPMTWTSGVTLMSFADPARLERCYDLIDAFLAPDSGAWWIASNGMGHSNARSFEAFSGEELAALHLPPDDVEGFIASGIFQATIRNEPELQAMFKEVKAGM